ncbi:MAG: Holliday junction branch migration DNA helicase RuvB [Candidatus Loosdrechtia sp.]|uniref:Holliday junction branch migration DNA helicase RuvB n=1 Tax=Candidatus Loosdrechtia sp. TaxID=3101272 RepID=UPI003A7A8711|nr:MAG: Holliday junction branch migration DNA helicase RuvB [Candidatus Jettenia sp. AMX2]
MSREGVLSSSATIEDKNLDVALRPKRLNNFIGQNRTKENLSIYIEAARKRGEPLDHILFSGPPGLGKTTLSQIIANEVNTSIISTSGPILDKPGDLAGILTNLQEGDIFFIDEIHRLNPVVEEYLYSAMEDFSIDIIIDQGPKARSVKINLQKFTLIGSTTREGLLTAPLRSRFGVLEKLEFYPWTDIYKIVGNSARILSVQIDEKGAETIARRSRGTPRIANRFLRRIRDVAQVRGNDIINEEVALMGLEMLGVDENGLSDMDRKILETIIRYNGGPVGLKTIAVSVSEEEDTIEEVYEAFLIQKGYMDRTPRGRVVTELAYEHLGRLNHTKTSIQKKMF